MLNLRKKIKKNLQTNTYSTLYYLYIKNKYFLNCAIYQKPFFFVNYFYILKKYIYILKFKTLYLSKNLETLHLPFLMVQTLYSIIKVIKFNKFIKKFKKFLIKNVIKLLLYSKKVLLFQTNKKIKIKNFFYFHKRWNLL